MRHEKRGESVRRVHSNGLNHSFAFRRSRTITGSAAGTVRAASETNGQLQSSRLHEHTLRKHRRKLSVYLVVSIIAAGGLWYVLASYMGSAVTTGTLSSQSLTQPIDQAYYQNLVQEYFRDRPLEHFQFALNEDDFSAYMRMKAPEVAKVELDTGETIGTTFLAVQFREPVVAWTIKGQQYFVDQSGVAFTTNYFAVPTVVVNDRSGISADVGVVASNRLLSFIGRVVTLVNASGIAPVQNIELPSDSTRQVDFKLEGKEYPVKAHLDRDPAGQAADIVSAVRYVESKGIKPSYLDVRVSSKAFYRDAQ